MLRTRSFLALILVFGAIYLLIDAWMGFDDSHSLDRKEEIREIVCESYRNKFAVVTPFGCSIEFKPYGYVIEVFPPLYRGRDVATPKVDICDRIDVWQFRQHVRLVKPAFTWNLVKLKFVNSRVASSKSITDKNGNSWTQVRYSYSTCYSTLIF